MREKFSHRLIYIDAMRGFVIILMMLDHVRETFFLHQQVGDPINVQTTDFWLFFSRSLAHICAPIFVLLTGISASLYAQKVQSKKDVSGFLLKRGLLLILLEVTIINFAWTFQFPPKVIYLQVIWAIGLSMIALSAIIWLHRTWIGILGLVIIVGHNLLDGFHFPADSFFYIPWAILHDRSWIEFGDNLRIRTSYPVLPWIGVIALGYSIGGLFIKSMPSLKRQTILLTTGIVTIFIFLSLRFLNAYGEKPWHEGDTLLQTSMSFFNITKYPPSLLFLLLTLGIGCILIALFEKFQNTKLIGWLAVFGSVPMFFYVFHLYILKFLYVGAVSIWGLNQGQYFGFDTISSVWLCSIILIIALYFPVRSFARFKAKRRDITWLKYF
ncbi:DUF1624 domain-containing protein [Bartonella tamiae]|uniref:Heparan-alpha-glucosaminide N-acetyltransferase catalytic domain-containing protein n=1 Tax=Bartonella tamiae Th239 TaxID=1094558 RepID=J0R3W4_9HYPH|nr:heparan-alpha-glucosaminide N-acetyltransferase domain-containing protein [Bartonella tamiae]EJF90334.1 hypothetical protein ME5_00735 [Bartonella tamiae Th239]EJF93725.1 hypothetical protein MEG_01149 [Bartonella tamiae Th307]